MRNKKNIALSLIVVIGIVFFCGGIAHQCYAQENAVQASAEVFTNATLIDRFKNREDVYYKKIAQTGFVITFGYLLMFLLVSMVNRQVKDLRLKHIVRKNVIYILNVIILLYIFFIWIQNISSVTIFLSVISAGIALALQEALLCIAGWFLIISRRPFEVGDRIEMNGVKGDVIDIRFFQTSLLEIGNWVDADQSTGRIVQVPNSAVFKKECFNYNRGFEYIWNEMPIVITFESDWKRAKEIMVQHAQKEAESREANFKRRINQMTKSYMIHFDKLTPIVYVNIKDCGVQLTLRYLTEAKKRRSTQDELCQAILEEFAKEERVDFAYPTYRIVKT